jgi:peroxiredoxin Q/BCP
MRHVKVLAAAAALVVAAGAAILTGQSAPELKVGDQAPDFALAGSDGKTHTLSDLRGRHVVVAWFPKAFTSGCTQQCKSLKESGEAIRAYDVAYYAASVDDAETNRKFAESLELDFPVLSDPGKDVAKAYGVVTATRPVAHRWTFYIGPDGRITHIDREINVREAGTDTAARLKALGVPEKS